MISKTLYKVALRTGRGVCAAACKKTQGLCTHRSTQRASLGRAEQEMGCGEPVEKGSGFWTGGHWRGAVYPSLLHEALPFACVQFSSVAQSCPTLRPHESQHARPPCPSTTLEFTQTHVHRVGDAIQPSHPLLSPFPPAPNPSQHQSFPVSQLFAWGGQSTGVSVLLKLCMCNFLQRGQMFSLMF